MKRITSFIKQYWAPLLIAVVFLITTNASYINLVVNKPTTHTYTGVGFEAVGDKFVYLSMIEQGRTGKLFMENIHTSEPQNGRLFSPHWTVIGLLSELFSLTNAKGYHLARIVLEIIFILLVYAAARALFKKKKEQLTAFAVALFASGAGWIYYLINPDIGGLDVNHFAVFNRVPVDLYVTEMVTFLAMAQAPLFIFVFILLLGLWFVLYRYWDNQSIVIDIILMLLAALIIMIHPYDTLTILLVTSIIGLIELHKGFDWYQLRKLAFIIIGTLAAAGYHFYVLATEPAIREWSKQNLTFSPQIGTYIWGLGILIPLWLYGTFLIIKHKRSDFFWMLMLAWSWVIALSIYLPIDFNRRTTTAWFVPLAFISAYAFIHLYKRIESFLPRTIIFIFISILLIGGNMYTVAQHALYDPAYARERIAYYMPPQFSDVVAFSNDNITYNDIVIFNNEYVAINIAAFSRMKLYLGHAHQTARYREKKAYMEWFYGNPSGTNAIENRHEFLKKNGITYVMFYKFIPNNDDSWLFEADFATQVFDNEAFSIYKIDE